MSKMEKRLMRAILSDETCGASDEVEHDNREFARSFMRALYNEKHAVRKQSDKFVQTDTGNGIYDGE